MYLEIDIRDEYSFEHLDIMMMKIETHILIRHKDLRRMTPQHCFKRVDSLS